MENQYLTLLEDILISGERRNDRTGVGTKSVFGRQLRFNLKQGFPAITTKKLAWRAVVGELLWFLEGSTDERRLAEITHDTREGVVTIWTPNALASYWKSKAKFDGDLGRVYGAQWRDFQGVDQIQRVVDNLKTNPQDRRHLVSAWNPADLDKMALPPCHVLFQFYVNNNNELSCHMYQRSVDCFLGLPFNIASYALLVHLIARECELGVHELIISTGDTHIYVNHLDQVRRQIDRKPFDFPTLRIVNQRPLFDYKVSDLELDGYLHHASLTGTMAV